MRVEILMLINEEQDKLEEFVRQLDPVNEVMPWVMRCPKGQKGQRIRI